MSGSTLDRFAETVAALMHGPKTYAELAEFTGGNKQVAAAHIRALRAAGVAYHLSGDGTSFSPYRFALQPRPFAESDYITIRR